MKIASSTVYLSSDHRMSKSYEKKEDLKVWDNRNVPGFDTVTISVEIKGLSISEKEKTEDDSIPADSKYYILAVLIAALTGEDVTILDAEKLNKKMSQTRARLEEAQQAAGQQAQGLEGWGISFTSVETYTEHEQTIFSAQGTVKTKDGKETAFNVSLGMDRYFSTSSTFDFKAGDALKDPLVINFGQGPATLSGKKVKFDINGDGNTEDMPFVGGSSGFLVFDKNGNGAVDSGIELFGPSTGDGFRELARLDEDKNSWIDENDGAYNSLRVWQKSGDAESLYSLKDLGIGAIYTGGAETPFEVRDSQNELNGMIQQTGLYLKEDGTVGTVQRLDIVV